MEARADASYPLSPMQEGMLFHSMLAPQSGMYIVHGRFTLRGPLDLAPFTDTWDTIVSRHTILRTSFSSGSGEGALQTVHATARVPVVYHDWRLRDRETQRADLTRYAQTDLKTDFDLSRPPLLRFALFRLSDDEHFCLWTAHHLVRDMRSALILVQEFGTLYEARVRGASVEVVESRPYKDYIDWLRGRDRGGDERFWREALAGFKGSPAFPIDYQPGSSRVAPQEPSGRSESLRLSDDLTAALRQCAKEIGGTVNTLFMGAWAVVLSRYIQSEDVAFGLTMSTIPEDLERAESIVGMQMNTLPLRVNVFEDASVRSMLTEIRAMVQGARRHADVSLVDLQQWSDSPPGESLFDSILVVQDYAPLNSMRLPTDPLSFSVLPHFFNYTHYPLTLVVERYGHISLALSYDSRLFEGTTIRRLLGHMQTVLHGMVADVEQPLRALSLLTEDERRQLVVEWNRTERPYPRDATIHELISMQAMEAPHAVALVCGDRQLSYSELERRSYALAQRLKELGVEPGTRVGICVDRSVEMIVGLVGILKAGGVYVPLSPDAPAARSAFMLEDVGASLLLTQRRGGLSAVPTPTLFLDDLVTDEPNPHNGQGFAPNTSSAAAKATDPAAIMYTSGSTGQPKGVEISHRNVIRLLANPDFVSLHPHESVLGFSPLAFDVSNFEIWWTLMHGARLVLAPPHLPSLTELAELIERERITTVCLSAGVFNQMVDHHLDALHGVRQLLSVGDVLSPDHARRVIAALAGCTLINGYGPTETTIFACCYAMNATTDIDGVVPIGRPIANTRVYILDSYDRPVPVGVEGELVIGGDGVAHGYHLRPQLTVERFIRDPFLDDPEATCYRSGDRARYRPDGIIEFRGRIDDQVKIGGNRVEPGEVAAVIGSHPGVRDVVVVTQSDGQGDRYLVAYVVAVPGETLTTHDLRAWLRDRLLEVMVPSSVVWLHQLPLGPTGKVDRSRLPQLQRGADRAASAAGPRTTMEEALARIFSEVLEVEHVGIHDDFFDLGGHSLHVMQIAARVKDVLGLDIPLARVFDARTVEELATSISPEQPVPAPVPALVRRPRVADRLASTSPSPGATTEAEEG